MPNFFFGLNNYHFLSVIWMVNHNKTPTYQITTIQQLSNVYELLINLSTNAGITSLYIKKK